MSDHLKGRVLENLFHGTPIYPFSSTPDGRIVTEQRKNRQQNEDFHRKSLAVQEKLTEDLTQVFDGRSAVTREDFIGANVRTHNLLEDQLTALDDMCREQTRTTHAIEEFGQTLHADMIGVRNDLGEINRSVQDGTQTLHRDMQDISSDLSDIKWETQYGANKVTAAVQDGARNLKGPAYSQPIQNFLNDKTTFVEALAAYGKGLLNQESRRAIERMINARFGSAEIEPDVKQQLLDEAGKNLSPEKFAKAGQQINYAVQLLRQPSLLLSESPDEAGQRLQLLTDLSWRSSDEKLRSFTDKANELFKLAHQARQSPVSPQHMVAFTNHGYLTDTAQHAMKENIREARKEGSLVDVNYNLMEANTQRDMSNHLLSNIASNLMNAGVQRNIANQLLGNIASDLTNANTQRNVTNHLLDNVINNLTETNDHLINLEKFAKGFIQVASKGFAHVTQGLHQISHDVGRLTQVLAFCHTETVNEIREVGDRLENQLTYANRLTEELIRLTRYSLTNVAVQRFEQGWKSLEIGEIDDAFILFTQGTEADPTTVGNQFGAGIAAELLKNWEEAIRRYKKAANYAREAEPSLSALAFYLAGRLEQARNNLPAAVELLKQAIQTDPSNLTFRFNLARYFALAADYIQAADTLMDLVKHDEHYLFRIRTEPAFTYLPLKELYFNAWQSHLITGLETQSFLLTEFLNFRDTDSILEVFKGMAGSTISKTVLKTGFWNHPLFDLIGNEVKMWVSQKIAANSLHSTADERYAASFLAYFLGLSPDQVWQCFKNELENDPAFYRQQGWEIKNSLSRINAAELSVFLSAIRKGLQEEINWLNDFLK